MLPTQSNDNNTLVGTNIDQIFEILHEHVPDFSDGGGQTIHSDFGLALTPDPGHRLFDSWDGIAAYLGDDDAAREDGGATYFDSGAGGLSEPQLNGSDATAVSVTASGDQSIDGLLWGTKWDGPISYSDPDAVSDYQATHPEDFTNFSQVTAQQMVAVHFGLNNFAYTQSPTAAGFSVEGFTDLSISYAGAGSGAGTIRVANTDDPGTAYAYFPNNGDSGGDAFFGPSGDFPDAGDYDWHTVLHELGHSLGLAHGHTGGAYGASPASEDSLEWSIMTYRTYIGGPTSGYTYEAWGAPQTFMRNDILALQHMYGADYTTNSGDTVYSWAPGSGDTVVNGTTAIDAGGNVIFATIWDGGGTDTYDLSAYTGGVDIDLTPGAGSIFDDTQRARLGSSEYASHSVYNAFLYNGDTASLIENAIGGSGNDTMQGNQGANTLTGNGGDDTINGGGGRDVLRGGSGSDILHGSAGRDAADYSTASEGVHVDLSLPGFQVISASAGNDRLIGIEDVIGSNYGDYLLGDSGHNIIDGGGNSDDLRGYYGNDNMFGGNGNDLMLAGHDNDTLRGEAGNDRLRGEQGNDLLIGGTGLDLADYSSSADGVTVDLNIAGFQTISTDSGSDRLVDIEKIVGSAYDDSISGDAGVNVFRGLDGDDTMSGEGSVDRLFGGNGTDRLTGGAARDIFYFLDVSESRPGSRDVITDFGFGPDIIRLNAIDADTGTAGNQAFDFIGTADFSDTAGELRYFVNHHGHAIVLGDVDGDGTADLNIALLDTSSLAADDFIL